MSVRPHGNLLSCLSFVIAFALPVSLADAHRIGESYVFLTIAPNAVSGRIEFTLADMDRALQLDENGDGKISPAEFEAHVDRVQRYVFRHFKLGVNGKPYAVRYTTHNILNTRQGRFAQLLFTGEGLDESPVELDVEHTLFFDVDPEQRVLVLIENNQLTGAVNNEETVSLILAPDNVRQTLNLEALSPWSAFPDFLYRGAEHIWAGIDHILFLLALILPSVLVREAVAWRPVDRFRHALIHVIKIVSLFTLAHTITLTLAAIGIVQLPARLVESIIALSVILAAINNLYPIFSGWIWAVVFLFGLFHGLGFASALSYLIVDRTALVPTLLGFNLGVEVGQVVMIIVGFPVLFVLRKSRFYPRLFVGSTSALIALIAIVWFIERAFELGPILAF